MRLDRPRLTTAASGAGSGNAATDSEEDELEAELQQARPRTVLSVFRQSVGRPLSSLSTRARSALVLSNTGQHLHDIPSNVRGVRTTAMDQSEETKKSSPLIRSEHPRLTGYQM